MRFDERDRQRAVGAIARLAEEGFDRDEPLLGALTELLLETSPLHVSRLDDPATRRFELVDLTHDLGLETRVDDGDSRGRRDRPDEVGAREDRGVVRERRRRSAVGDKNHHTRRSASPPPSSFDSRDRARRRRRPLFQPVTEDERAIAERVCEPVHRGAPAWLFSPRSTTSPVPPSREARPQQEVDVQADGVPAGATS